MYLLTLIGCLMATTFADIPEGVTVERDLTYVTVDGKDLKLDVYWQSEQTEPAPLIVWIHGGAWRKGNKANPLARSLLAEGYAVASVQYRLSQEAIFPAQINDCKAAVRWLRSNASRFNIDPEKFGAWGTSAGGHLVALLGTAGDVVDLAGALDDTEVSSRVQAVCDWFGPTDFLRMNDIVGKIDHDGWDSPESQLIGTTVQDHPDRVARANPVTYVTDDDPPFLIMHGAKDVTVIKNQSEILHAALQKTGVSSNMILIDDLGHGLRRDGKVPQELLDQVLSFFDHELRGHQSEWATHDKNPHPWVTEFGRNTPRTHDVLFYSKIADAYYGYTIYLPPSYDNIDAHLYPTVYWLHGRNGRPHGANRFFEDAHHAIETGLCPEMVIVAPTGLPGSMYVDSKDGVHPVESVIIKDLIPHIEATYRVIPNREMRAIDGFSMGGFGAAHLGFKYPELFGTISLMGSAIHRPEFLRDERSDIFAAAFGGDLAYCEKESPWTLVRQGADALRDRTSMRLYVGMRDFRLKAKNMAFSTIMETLKLSHEYGLVPRAGHNLGQVLDGIGDDAWTYYAKAFEVE
jgi:acetyl esterase/lipase/enterochelin esterase-like enzyme